MISCMFFVIAGSVRFRGSLNMYNIFDGKLATFEALVKGSFKSDVLCTGQKSKLSGNIVTL